MTTDIARLGFTAETADLDKVDAKLDKLAQSSKSVDSAQQKLAATQTRLANAQRSLDTSTAKLSVSQAKMAAAQSKLNALHKSGTATASQLATAELQLASAKASVTAANNNLASAEARVMGIRKQELGARQRLGQAIKASNASLKTNNGLSRAAAAQQQNLVFQLNDVATSLALGANPMTVALQQGGQLSTIYGPGEGGLGRAFKETGKLITGALTKFPLLTAAVGLAAVGIGGLTFEINKTTDVSVGMMDVVLAVFQTIGDVIKSVLLPAWQAIAPAVTAVWDAIVLATKTTINTVVALFVGAKDAISFVWGELVGAIGAPVIASVNFTLQAIENMINSAIDLLNTALVKISQMLVKAFPDQVLDLLPGGGVLGSVDQVSLGKLQAPEQQSTSLGEIAGGISGAFSDAFSRDFTGEFFEMVRSKAIQNALGDIEESAKSAGSALKKPVELLKGGLEGAKEITNALKDTVGGFFKDFISGIRQGENAWDSFKKAALNALDKIIDKLIDMATNQLITQLLGGLIGGGGGVSSIVGGGGVIPGFAPGQLYASGGYTGSGSTSSVAGLVHGQEFVMNASATRKHRSVLEAMNAGRNTGNNSMSDNKPTNIAIVSRFDGNGDFVTMVEGISEDVSINTVRDAAPQIVDMATSKSSQNLVNGNNENQLNELGVRKQARRAG